MSDIESKTQLGTADHLSEADSLMVLEHNARALFANTMPLKAMPSQLAHVGLLVSNKRQYEMLRLLFDGLPVRLSPITLEPTGDAWILGPRGLEMEKRARLDDLQDILEHIQQSQMSQIIGYSEASLIDAGLLREALGIVGQSFGSAVAFRDKLLMKRLLSEACVPVPDFDVYHRSIVDTFLQKHAHVLIKPRLAWGSRGIIELKVGNAAPDATPALDFMMEEFIPGALFHADGLVVEGAVTFLFISEYLQSPLSYQSGSTAGSVILSPSDPLYNSLQEFVRLVIRSMPLPTTSAFHLDIFRTEDGRLLAGEIASRTAGNRIRGMIFAASGIDIVGDSLRAQIWPRPRTRLNVRLQRVAGWGAIRMRKGLLARLPDFRTAPAGVHRIKLHAVPGQALQNAVGSSDNLVSFVLVGNTQNEIRALHRSATLWAEDVISNAMCAGHPQTSVARLCS